MQYLILRYHAKPPRVDETLALYMLDMMPIALVLHLCIALWMHSVSFLPSAELDMGTVAAYASAHGRCWRLSGCTTGPFCCRR